jgi:hypothetical protein
MELSITTKFRLAVVAGLGVLLIGLWAWPMAEPATPFTPVMAGNIAFGNKIILFVLAVFTGFIAYFLSWPYGREIGILAVPAGLAVWAIRGGGMSKMIVGVPVALQRYQLYSGLKWEGLFWFMIVLAGIIGILAAQFISTKKNSEATIGLINRLRPLKLHFEKGPEDSRSDVLVKSVAALVICILLIPSLIAIFARDVQIVDRRAGVLVAQPGLGQTIFAVIVSFDLAAFFVKTFLNRSYYWPMFASSLILAFVSTFFIKQNLLTGIYESWPAVFTPHSVLSITPLTMVTFGTLGSIWGYWTAVRYYFWRHYESKTA